MCGAGAAAGRSRRAQAGRQGKSPSPHRRVGGRLTGRRGRQSVCAPSRRCTAGASHPQTARGADASEWHARVDSQSKGGAAVTGSGSVRRTSHSQPPVLRVRWVGRDRATVEDRAPPATNWHGRFP
eukprot:scaffold1112_cov116-Isochrysis_galbana.AAC.1